MHTCIQDLGKKQVWLVAVPLYELKKDGTYHDTNRWLGAFNSKMPSTLIIGEFVRKKGVKAPVSFPSVSEAFAAAAAEVASRLGRKQAKKKRSKKRQKGKGK